MPPEPPAPPSAAELIVGALPSVLLVTSAVAFFVASTVATPIVLLMLAIIVAEAFVLASSALFQPRARLGGGLPTAPGDDLVYDRPPQGATLVIERPAAESANPFETAEGPELQTAVATAIREQRQSGAARFVAHHPGAGFMVLDAPPAEPGSWYLRLAVGGPPVLARTLAPELASLLASVEAPETPDPTGPSPAAPSPDASPEGPAAGPLPDTHPHPSRPNETNQP